ncbi:MAG: ABC transporter ATP-binding protein, partial [Anaeroplasmataceae bacterium]|nr:ABC transporter ATP-binding protein [Anaeroplasmataceae bacterium]
MIKIKKLNKYYFKGKRNELHVIDDTNLELPDKGLISILGPSGSGKTTLLNVIGGLDKASGTITYEEKSIRNSNMRKVDAYRKDHIGYIFQNYNLLHEETVSENLRIALEMVGVTDKEEVEKRIEYTLKAVGMFKFRKKQAYALSGGQQQRVAIARALVKNAKIIIADEPTGNLDNENTIEVMNILKKISKNTLVLLVTHDIKIAHFYADYIVEIKDGKILSFNKQEEDISLSTNLSNRVYLKDLHQSEVNTTLGTTRIFKDKDEEFKIDIDIIVRNGNIYLKSDQPIKLVESSNLKLIDDHYRDLSSKTFEDISYDTSWFENKKRGIKEFLYSFWQIIRKAFLTFKNVNKRSKVLYFAFFCIGVLLGASVICTINFATPDTSEFFYAQNEYKMISPDHTFTEDPIIKIKQNFNGNTLIKPSIINEEDSLIFKLDITYHKQVRLKLNTIVLRCVEEDIRLIYGSYPKQENEVVIDAKNARLISNEYGIGSPLQEALGDMIELHSKEGAIKEAKIVGICDSAQKAIYTTDEFYTKWLCYRDISFFGDYRYYEKEVDANGNPLYEVISGKLEPAQNNFFGGYTNLQALVHEDNIAYLRKETIGYNGKSYKIVGTYKYK